MEDTEGFKSDFDGRWNGMAVGKSSGASASVAEWRFVLLAAKADEEVRCNEWGLPHFGGAENCSDCLCNKSTRPYTDLQASAAWRPTADMDYEGWVARIREPVHPLLKSDAHLRSMEHIHGAHAPHRLPWSFRHCVWRDSWV